MSPLRANPIVPLLRRAPGGLWAAICLLLVLLQAPTAAAAVGGGLFGRMAAGPAPIPVQATSDDVYSESPNTGDVYKDDVYKGDGDQPTRERQEPTKRKRSKVPWFQIQIPPIKLPETKPQDPELVAVPDLLGRVPAEAAGLLAERRLVLREGRLLDGKPGTGERVVAQDPAAGARVKPGSPVTVDIALPPPLFPIPAIVGMTLQQAIAAVREGGFSFESKSAAPVDAERDRIVAQTPEAGSLQPLGTPVTGELEPARVQATPPPPLPERKPLVTVPDLAGLSRDAAAGRLDAARLSLAGPSQDELADPAAVVTTQSPTAGSEVPPRTQVAVTLEAPPLETAAGDEAPTQTLPEAPPEAPPAPPPEVAAPREAPEEPALANDRQTPQTAPDRQQTAPDRQQRTPDVVVALTARDLWWAAGGAILVLLLLAGWLLVRPRGAAPAKLPVVSYKAERDPGAQQIAWDAEPGLRCRLHLRAVADRGNQILVIEQEPRPVRRYG
jgi:beta-lactam-binding protein with PASTA domain